MNFFFDSVGLKSEPCTCWAGILLFEPHPHSFLIFNYFSDNISCFYPGPALEHNNPNYASNVAGIMGVLHNALHDIG
jgi:hypothetical protein